MQRSTDMRILHCVSSLKVGGAEKCVKNLVKAQNQKNLSVEILSFGHRSDSFQQEIEALGINVININGNIVKRLWLAAKVITKFSSIHIHSPAVIKAFAPIFPILLLKRVIYTIHGEIEPPISFVKGSHKLASLYLNDIFAVSESIKQGIGVRYGWSSCAVTVVNNGVYCPPTPNDIAQQTSLNLCTVCRLVPLKNISQLVEEFARRNLAGYAVLNIFGDGPERERIERLVSKHKLHGAVVMHGEVLDEDDIYAQQDLLLINSTTEGLPMSLLEAMARGIPALSTSVGQIPNLITQNENGFTYPVDDTEGWYTLLLSQIKDRDNLIQVGRRAFAFVKQNYAINDVSSVYEAKYR
jgi:glycosyltransferase involved in cell wall biosynthesis